MSPAEHALLLEFVAGLAVLWFAHSYMWRRTRLRSFREDLFTMRDELFDYMWQKGLSYDLPAYGEMRSLFNGSIRVIEYLRGPLVIHLAGRFSQRTEPSSLFQTIEAIEDPEVKRHFKEVLVGEFGGRLIRYLGLHWFVLAALIDLWRQTHRRNRIREMRQRVAAELSEELVQYGHKDSPEACAVAELATSHAR